MSASVIACFSAVYAWSRKLTLAASGRSVSGIAVVPAPPGIVATGPVLSDGRLKGAAVIQVCYIPKTTSRVATIARVPWLGAVTALRAAVARVSA